MSRPGPRTPAEQAAILRAKAKSPWGKGPNCTGIKAQAAFKKLARKP